MSTVPLATVAQPTLADAIDESLAAALAGREEPCLWCGGRSVEVVARRSVERRRLDALPGVRQRSVGRRCRATCVRCHGDRAGEQLHAAASPAGAAPPRSRARLAHPRAHRATPAASPPAGGPAAVRVFLLLIFVAVWAGVRVAHAGEDGAIYTGHHYTVSSGDDLWTIAADEYGGGVDLRQAVYAIREANQLDGSAVQPGSGPHAPLSGRLATRGRSRGRLREHGVYWRRVRDVAQPGSAPALGAGGREFKSRRPDQCPTCGSSSVGRASAFQAEGRGFETRLPLHCRLGPSLRGPSGWPTLLSSYTCLPARP